MKELTIRKLQGETIAMFSEVVLLKMNEETVVYDVTNLDDVSTCDVLERIFADISVWTFDVTCSEEQTFLAGLSSINGFKILGEVETGEHFEIDFEHFSPEAEELLNVDNDSNCIGVAEYDERTTEWITESTIDKESKLYRLLKQQAEKCDVKVDELDTMLELIEQRCTGSDVEY